jgi:hypothetical protein
MMREVVFWLNSFMGETIAQRGAAATGFRVRM